MRLYWYTLKGNYRYTHVPGNCYNVTSLGTQEVEQFFSTFRDLDPSGLGTPKPDAIPAMVATASWLVNIRMDPDRSFHMKTASATMYPEVVLESSNIPAGNLSRNDSDCSDYNLHPTPRDHFFDLESRKRVKSKRKSGEVAEPDKPAHRQLGVRLNHVCDDSQVLAEYRIKDIEKFQTAMADNF